MPREQKLSRREFLALTATSAVGIVAASCAAPTAQVIEKEVPVEKIVKETVVVEKEVAVEKVVKETVVVEKEVAVQKEVVATAPVFKYKEAPMLAKLVAAGKLPPVDERLPEEPWVVKGQDGIGKYGGGIRRSFNGVSDSRGPENFNRRALVWFTPELEQAPRIAKSWETNADGSVWTFHLRKGMKWSDGAPFTSKDAIWWWQNMETYKPLKGSPSEYWVSGPDRTPAVLTAPDDYTITFTFNPKKPLFLLPLGDRECYAPAHYLQNYHIDFTKDKAALEKEFKAVGFDSWDKYFNNQNTKYLNPNLPILGAWVAKNPLSEEIFIMERNPYFFAVDESGQQLPYLDTVSHRLVSSADVRAMRVINGEIDFQARSLGFADWTLYKENEAKGDYKVYVNPTSGHVCMKGNMTSKNQKVAELFAERKVRMALSYAVDRDVINDLLYDGVCESRQYSPIPGSPQYYDKLSKAYLEYDPAKASQLLDEAGYDKKDAEGFRLWKDGSGPVSFIIEGTAATGSLDEDAILVVCKYFADIGLKATYNYAERSLYTQHYRANDIEAAWYGASGGVLPLMSPDVWIGRQEDRPWSRGWEIFYREGKDAPNAVEPPAGHWIWDLWNIWDEEVSQATDSKVQTEGFLKILDIWYEELPFPAYIGLTPAIIVVKNGFKGYRAGLPHESAVMDEHLLNTETYYWENPEAHVI